MIRLMIMAVIPSVFLVLSAAVFLLPSKRLHPLTAGFQGIFFFLLLVVCSLGFLSTFEPLPPIMTWAYRLGYGLTALVSMAGLGRLVCRILRLTRSA